MKSRGCRAVNIIIAFVIALSSMLSLFSASYAENEPDGLFIESILYGSPSFNYKVNYIVTDTLLPKTGRYDEEKAYFIMGNSLSSYQSGKQIFENGRYGSSKWTPDYKKLAGYISSAVSIYCKEEKYHGEAENRKAKEIITYGFEYLPLTDRLSVKNAASWLFDDISGASQRIGDINGDRKVDDSDVALLDEVLLGRLTVPLYVCDTNGDGFTDPSDVSALKNYMIYIYNVKKEQEIQNPVLKVISLGDSIARGYGLGNEGKNGTSLSAYGNKTAEALDELMPYDIEFTNYGFDGDKLSDMVDKINTGFKRISSDEPLDRAVKDADIILISIGGNDLLAALRNKLTSVLGVDITDEKKVFKAISDMSFTDVLAFIANPEIDDFIKNSAEEFGKSFETELKTILKNNPDAYVVVTAIPDAVSDTDLMYRYELFGIRTIKIMNFYDTAGKWISFYNEAIEKCIDSIGSDRLILADPTDKFDGSYEYILMNAPAEIYVNDLANDTNELTWKFDIHPSAKGHQIMAESHIAALENAIDDLNAHYVKQTADTKGYVYDADTGNPGISIVSSAYGGKTVLTVKCSKKVGNLYVTLTSSGDLTISKADVSSQNGTVKYNYDKDHVYLMSYSEKSDIREVRIELVFEGAGKSNIDLEAVAAQNTEQGVLRCTANCTEAVEILPDTAATQKSIPGPVTDKTTNKTDKPKTEKITTAKSQPVIIITDESITESSTAPVVIDSENIVTTDETTAAVTSSSDGNKNDPPVTDLPQQNDEPNTGSTVIIDNDKKDPAVYIVIITAVLVLAAAAVITTVSLIKNNKNSNKNKKEG